MQAINPFHSSALNKNTGIQHAFFSREGGASTGLLDSLNFSLSKGDTLEAITYNRAQVAQYYGDSTRLPQYAKQVHGRDVLVIHEPFDFFSPPEVDGLITKTPNLVIGVQTADCIPLLLYEARAQIIGAIHVGWKGAYLDIIEEALCQIQDLGGTVQNIQAAIGPCIHQSNYEVDQIFYDKFRIKHAAAQKFFKPSTRTSHYLFDLPSYATWQLQEGNVASVDTLAVDTYNFPDRFYSCRRAFHKSEATYGCTLATIMLKS
jgi:YfiH family protein